MVSSALLALAGSAEWLAASGQEMLRDWSGVSGSLSTDDQFGASVVGIGDVDGDGVPDAAISAPWEDPSYNVELGDVYVISGATGVVLQHQFGASDRTIFGYPLCVPGDLDGDGVNDYLVSATDGVFYTGPGVVNAYSGATGSNLFTLSGPWNGSRFGYHVRDLGDVDADGVADFGIGDDPTGLGDVYVYSGATLAVLYSFHGATQNPPSNMVTVCGVGDLDSDGHADFGVGAAGDGSNSEGAFTVYSGSSGAILWSLLGEQHRSFFGWEACSLGDTDADGVTDFAVTAHAYTGNLNSQGRVYVYSGRTSGLLWEFTGTTWNEQLGILPRNGPIDFNHDGYDDIPIGSFMISTAYIYSGRTGTLLYKFNTGNGDTLGGSLAAAGDVNGDGIDDILIGAPDDSRYYAAAGRAYVYAGNDLFLQSRKNEYHASDQVSLTIRGGEPGNPSCIVLTDLSGTPLFVPVLIGLLDAVGNLHLTGTTPSGLSGMTMTFMGYAIGANGHTVIDSSPETITFK
jgi:hypothetical protein